MLPWSSLAIFSKCAARSCRNSFVSTGLVCDKNNRAPVDNSPPLSSSYRSKIIYNCLASLNQASCSVAL
eukprot:1096526-Pyramimonas_sp.AAC.1